MEKEIMKKALAMMNEYIAKMGIDYFSFPEQTSRGVNMVLINAAELANAVSDCIENGFLPELLTIEKGEEFFRVRRQYSPVKMWVGLQGIAKIRIDTGLSKIKDIPRHKNMQARGWELITAKVVNGEHTGDDITKIDVASLYYGNIECKFGGGRVYTASKMGD